MNAISEPDTIQAALSLLIGQRLLGTRNFCATRQFYFGQENLDDPHYTLGVECPWRIRRRDTIIVGSEDYYETDDDNPGESCEASAPNPQNRKLAELLGDLRGELAVNTGTGLVVESVHPEMCSGFRIDLGEACVLEVFPASWHQMEWIFMMPGAGSLVLMNGVVTKTKRRSRQ